MSANSDELSMSANLDELFGTQEGQEEAGQSFLGGGQEFQFVRPLWFTGYKVGIVVNGKVKSKARGFWYEVGKMPSDFMEAMKKLREEGQAIFATIRHGDGTEKEYCSIVDARYFVLTHGTYSRAAIVKDETKQVGLATGTWTTYYPKLSPPKTDKNTFLSALVVVQQLYEAGYVEELTGAPKLVNLHMKGIASSELHAALSKHFELLMRGRDIGLPARMQQYWAYSQSLDATDEEVTHGSGQDSQDVFAIESKHPPKSEWDLEYLDAIRADAVLFAQLFPLLFDMTSVPRRPGGLVIDWCRETIQAAKDNQEQFTGPNGQQIVYGNKKDAPAWLVNRAAMQDAAVFSEEAVDAARGTRAAPKAEKAAPASPLAPIRTTLQRQKAWFELQLEDDDQEDQMRTKKLNEGLILVQRGLVRASNKMNLDETELAEAMDDMIGDIAAIRATCKR